MKREVEVYLAGSIDSSEGIASYTSLLVCGIHRKELSRKIKGIFKEVLYTGVLDTIHAMKESCSITFYTLQELTFKEKKYAKLTDDISSAILSHIVKFEVLDEHDPKRIILDRVKRNSKSLLTTSLKRINYLYSATENLDFYFGEKIPVSKTLSATDEQDYGYLNPLNPETKELIMEIIQREGLNLYHSVQAIIENKKDKPLSALGLLEYYYSKYKTKRPYLVGNEQKMLEIINLCLERRGLI